jgi:hypothetical protein
VGAANHPKDRRPRPRTGPMPLIFSGGLRPRRLRLRDHRCLRLPVHDAGERPDQGHELRPRFADPFSRASARSTQRWTV